MVFAKFLFIALTDFDFALAQICTRLSYLCWFGAAPASNLPLFSALNCRW